MAFIGNTNTTQAFTPAIDYFSGTGSATAFTLSRPVASVAQVQVTIDNVAQNPSSAYTVSGSTITFTSAPLSGTNNIYVYYTSPITQVIAPGQGTVGTTALVDASVTTAKLASTTGSGAVVLATSPTLTTPDLGTPSALVATNLTGTANSLNAGIGVNQTWQDVTASRAVSTNYTNTTGKPIFVKVTYQNGSLNAVCGGVTLAPASAVAGEYASQNFIVPPSQVYSVTSGGTKISWTELR